MQRPALAMVLVLLATLVAGAPLPAAPGPEEKLGETLLPGPPCERSIAAGESHLYRVTVTDTPLLLSVEQRGIDLVVEARGTTSSALTSDALNGRWGPEVLLLRAPDVYRIEIRPGVKDVPVGRYAIQLEGLSPATIEEKRRAEALAATSRALQLGGRTSAALQQALKAYREALATWRSLGDRRWEAETLQSIAVLEQRFRRDAGGDHGLQEGSRALARAGRAPAARPLSSAGSEWLTGRWRRTAPHARRSPPPPLSGGVSTSASTWG